MLRVCFALTLLIGLFSPAEAQKFGHVNFGNLVSQMPGTEEANKQLEDFSKQLTEQGEAMRAKLEADYKLLQEDYDNLTPNQVKERTAALEKGRDEMLRFQQKAQMQVEEKRRELLSPILERAQAMVKTVAEEQGYTMVFDSSVFNTLLFTEEGTDLTDAVLARLKQ